MLIWVADFSKAACTGFRLGLMRCAAQACCALLLQALSGALHTRVANFHRLVCYGGYAAEASCDSLSSSTVHQAPPAITCGQHMQLSVCMYCYDQPVQDATLLCSMAIVMDGVLGFQCAATFKMARGHSRVAVLSCLILPIHMLLLKSMHHLPGFR